VSEVGRGGPSGAPASSAGAAALVLPDPPLADDAAGIVLRPWRATQADVAALVAAWTDPVVAAANGVPDDVSASRAARWIRGDAARRAQGRSLDLVVGPVSGAPIVLGEVGLRNVDRSRGRGEISWWISADHRGQGLAVAAARLLAGWALGDQGGFRQVWARIDPANRASVGVASSAGLVRLGVGGGAEVWARARET
jgi:RimJ/RimL family protein N-acetyltransferase